MWRETMKHVDMRSDMEHFSKLRKGQRTMARQVISTMKIIAFFQEFLMILNKLQRSHEAEVCN